MMRTTAMSTWSAALAPAPAAMLPTPRRGDIVPPAPRRWVAVPPAQRGRAMAALLPGVLLALAMSACSVFMPKFQTPHFTVVGIQLGRSDLFQQHLLVRLHVENPNDRDLPVQGLDYQLTISGEQVAQGASEASFVVPALGSADFNMTVTANLAAALVRLFGHGSSGPIEYRLTGRVHLAAGLVRSVPFEEKGTFQLH